MLPDLPSDLIEAALHDLEAVENDKRYTVDMRDWHKPRGSRGCSVCLAGAVMAKSLDCKLSADVTPAAFVSKSRFEGGEVIEGKLTSLDHFREGDIRAAFEALDKLDRYSDELPDSIPVQFDVTPYRLSPVEFKADMRSLAGLLRDCGY